MGFTWVTAFDCGACGASKDAAAVEYDRLGYPVCPECGESSVPSIGISNAPVQPSN